MEFLQRDQVHRTSTNAHWRPASSLAVRTRGYARHAGFTLLELIISIGLGVVILLICFAALRVTAQSIIASKQISLDNRLLRIGVERSLEEVDFWNLMDNPLDQTKQQLRGIEVAPATSMGNGNGFLPFTPFTQTPDYVADPVNGMTGFEDSTGQFDEPLQGAHGGWSSSPLAWAAWNPRTWTRASPADKSTKGQSWGTTEIYDNLDQTQSWHYWYDDQVRGLADALGFYGLYDYLPSNAHIVYHGVSVPLGSTLITATPGSVPTNGPISWCSIPSSLITDGSWLCPDILYNAAEGQDNVMKGRVRNSNYSRTFLPSPQGEVANIGAGIARTSAPVGINGRYWQESLPNVISDQISQVTTFMQQTLVGEELMPLRPANWDDVTYETHRFMERGQPVTACIVTCSSSLTARKFIISFTCLGTTLRGARQQRTPPSGAGWVVNPDVEPTLDYQSPP